MPFNPWIFIRSLVFLFGPFLLVFCRGALSSTVPNFLVYGAFLRKWAAKFRGFQVFDFLYYTLIWYAVRYNILLSLPFNPDVTQHHPTTNASILAPHPSWQHPTFQPYPPHVLQTLAKA